MSVVNQINKLVSWVESVDSNDPYQIASRPKLYYFDMKGRAEPTRLAFYIGGVDFDDVRISRDEFAKMKKSGDAPFGQLPVLEINGRNIPQSLAQLRFAGKLAGLYPSDPYEAFVVDSLLECMEDMTSPIIPTFRMSGSEQLKERKRLADEVFPSFFEKLDKLITTLGATTQFSIFNLRLMGFVEWLNSGMLDGIPKGIVNEVSYPNVMEVVNRTSNHPKVKQYYSLKK